MAATVVDASALAAVFFLEEGFEPVFDRLSGHALMAPELLGYEMANICTVKSRRHPEQAGALRTQFAAFQECGIRLLPVNQLRVVELAASTGLTAYDASYLWLALEHGTDLITLDTKLARACDESTGH